MVANISLVAGLVVFLVLGAVHSIHAAFFSFETDHDPNTAGASSAELSGQLPTVEPLAIWCPNPLLTSIDGKAVSVTLTPKVTGEATPITTTCSPTSGSLFPVGSASFTCNAVDGRQQKASCTSNVVVMSATAQLAPRLSLTCPTIARVTESGNGEKTAVKFADPTFSGGTAPVAVTCSPKSGSQFSVGTTTVSCQATDAARQTAACTTSATVLPASRGSGAGK